MMAPTERSMPSVPITSASPSDTSSTGETCTSKLENVPNEAKFSVKIRLKTRRRTKAT